MSCTPIAGTIVRRVGRERPDIVLAWVDSEGSLIDFTGYTFALSIALAADSPSLISKSSGIVYDLDSDGEYNVRISFTPGELDTLEAGIPYNCQLDATSASLDRGFQDFILYFTPEHS